MLLLFSCFHLNEISCYFFLLDTYHSYYTDRKQEPFQSNTTFTIRDTDDILTNNNIGRIINMIGIFNSPKKTR